MMRRIRVLNPTSAWGGGHIQTCINILKGMSRLDVDVHLHLLRARVDMTGVPNWAALRGPAARFGLPRLEPWHRRRTERHFLASLRDGDIAWIWPGTSLATCRELHRRGHPVIMEGINTRQASARRIVDRVYADAGAPEGYGITDAMIEQEDAMLSLATHFFSPSPGVDAALLAEDSPFSGQIMRSSYGAWLPEAAPSPAPGGPDDPVTVLFMGSVDLRKNAHGLLGAWHRLGPCPARLVLCGAVSPHVAQICARELALPSVEARGFVSDTAAEYRRAGLFVMPSFEEGDPQVTYEAASHGLPILASPMGGGRMAERTDAVNMIDPYDTDHIAGQIGRFIDDAALRQDYAARARAAAPQFDWAAVARERYGQLCEAFGNG